MSVRIAARIPDALAERITRRAELETRSLSNMIERLLELGLGTVVTERDYSVPTRLASAGEQAGVSRSVTSCSRERMHRSGEYCKGCDSVPP